MHQEIEETAQSADSEDSGELKLHQAASRGQREEVRRLIEEETYNPMDEMKKAIQLFNALPKMDI